MGILRSINTAALPEFQPTAGIEAFLADTFAFLNGVRTVVLCLGVCTCKRPALCALVLEVGVHEEDGGDIHGIVLAGAVAQYGDDGNLQLNNRCFYGFYSRRILENGNEVVNGDVVFFGSIDKAQQLLLDSYELVVCLVVFFGNDEPIYVGIWFV